MPTALFQEKKIVCFVEREEFGFHIKKDIIHILMSQKDLYAQLLQLEM